MSPQRDPRRIGYVLSRFPKLSETFILREMDALERLGWHIDVFPFTRHQEAVRHPEVERWLERLDLPDTLLTIIGANAVWLCESPLRLFSLYMLVTRELWRHPGELARGLMALARAGLWARRVRARGICHVHAHFARHQAVAALAIAHLAGITFSFTGHSHDVYRHPAMLAKKVRRARFVAVVSRLLRDTYLAPLVKERDLSKVHVIRCGLETATYKPTSTVSRRRPLVILAVTRLIDVKGVTFLIEACRLLMERGHDLRCHIIGDGPLRRALEEQSVRAGMGDRIAFLGSRAQCDVQRALEEASIFVLPSIVTRNGTMEGVPVSLMEAMARGVPVVATSTGAIPELVEDSETGLLVSPGDAQALANAIERLIGDAPLARRVATRARRRVVDGFDLHGNSLRLHHLLLQATGADERCDDATCARIAV